MRVAWTSTIVGADGRAAAIGFAAVAVLGFDEGGYFERSWGWAVLGFAALTALALLLREEVVVGPLESVSLASLAALAAWMLASDLWGISGTEAAREAERTLVYLAGLGALLGFVERASVRALLAGVLGGTVALATYGLGDRVLGPPGLEPFEGSLLVEPLGYANALGILTALGLVIGLGVLLSERRWRVVALTIAAAGVLAVALALTSSRGAWFSLACGLVVLGVMYARATHRHIGGRSLAVGITAAVVIALWLVLTPQSRFGDRPDFWRAAINDTRAHPISGSGAGSFDDYWLAHRNTAANVHDAHSLYLESLAELGPVGLLLVLGVLVPPLAAAAIARTEPAVAVAAGGYTAFLVHTGLDWDWEMPATTLAGLACGAALLAAVRPSSPPLSRRTRVAGVVAALAFCVLALIIVLLGSSSDGLQIRWARTWGGWNSHDPSHYADEKRPD
jgi:O-antigen ligase